MQPSLRLYVVKKQNFCIMKNVENQNNKDFYFSILILKKALNLFGM